jgi:hypothetical protein
VICGRVGEIHAVDLLVGEVVDRNREQHPRADRDEGHDLAGDRGEVPGLHHAECRVEAEQNREWRADQSKHDLEGGEGPLHLFPPITPCESAAITIPTTTSPTQNTVSAATATSAYSHHDHLRCRPS